MKEQIKQLPKPSAPPQKKSRHEEIFSAILKGMLSVADEFKDHPQYKPKAIPPQQKPS